MSQRIERLKNFGQIDDPTIGKAIIVGYQNGAVGYVRTHNAAGVVQSQDFQTGVNGNGDPVIESLPLDGVLPHAPGTIKWLMENHPVVETVIASLDSIQTDAATVRAELASNPTALAAFNSIANKFGF